MLMTAVIPKHFSKDCLWFARRMPLTNAVQINPRATYTKLAKYAQLNTLTNTITTQRIKYSANFWFHFNTLDRSHQNQQKHEALRNVLYNK